MFKFKKYENLIGKEVYACSFELANSKKGTIIRHQEPCKGIICESGYCGYLSFIPYSDKGNLLKSKAKRLDTCNLKFFDDYKECKKYYNSMILKRIEEVEKQRNDLVELLIIEVN